MSPTKESPASLSPVESMSLVEAYQRKGESKLLSESPRRRRIDEPMRMAFLDMCWPQGPITRGQLQFSQEWA